jgi:cell division protein FtsB
VKDIGKRIVRYRLSRYASPDDPWRRRIVRLVVPALLIWIVYAGLLSEHSWWRLWRLNREQKQTATRLDATRGEIERLERQIENPDERRALQEKVLRERNGYARPAEIVYRIDGAPPDSSAR